MVGSTELESVTFWVSIVELMADHADAVTVKFRLTNSEVFLALSGHTLRKMWFLLLLPIVGTISTIVTKGLEA